MRRVLGGYISLEEIGSTELASGQRRIFNIKFYSTNTSVTRYSGFTLWPFQGPQREGRRGRKEEKERQKERRENSEEAVQERHREEEGGTGVSGLLPISRCGQHQGAPTASQASCVKATQLAFRKEKLIFHLVAQLPALQQKIES